MKIAVAQLGARMHYAVPKIFAQAGVLEMLFTDICGSAGLGRWISALPSNLLPNGARRLAARKVKDIPLERLASFDRVGLEYWWRLRRARTRCETAQVHLGAGEAFAEAIMRHGLGAADTVYTFNSAGLSLLKHARERGLRTVHEQTIAPVAVQIPLLKEEQVRWPGWEIEAEFEDSFQPFLENENSEWALADKILCGSDFVRDGIKKAGGPVERAIVVPYGVDMKVSPAALNKDGEGDHRPLRVLTVGTVCLRKGSPYVMGAAQRMKNHAEFRMAGPVDLTHLAARKMAEHVNLLGIVPRSEMASQFAWADVFLLPSICEGSATATYEALAWGLPVVTTANAGSPILDGQHGCLVPVRDVDAIVGALQRLKDSRLREEWSANARKYSQTLTVSAYGRRLMEAIL